MIQNLSETVHSIKNKSNGVQRTLESSRAERPLYTPFSTLNGSYSARDSSVIAFHCEQELLVSS